MIMKWFTGSSMGNGGFKRQRDGICISQRKSSSQMIVRSYGTFPWGQCLEHNSSDISVIDKKNKRCQLLYLSCQTQVSLKMDRKARVRLRSRDDAETVFSWTGYNITKNKKKERKQKPLQLKSLVAMHCGFKMPRQQYQFWEEK